MSQSEQIIRPAPAQTTVSTESASSGAQSNNSEVDKAKLREQAIKDLSKNLRMINNICGPLCDYAKFESSINPDIRVLLNINQWMIVMCALKAASKCSIDSAYMDISDPPESLKQTLKNVYTNLDSVTEAFSSSMKEIITLIQSRLIKPTEAETSIIAAMNNDSHRLFP
jgi:hypothetical protein